MPHFFPLFGYSFQNQTKTKGLFTAFLQFFFSFMISFQIKIHTLHQLMSLFLQSLTMIFTLLIPATGYQILFQLMYILPPWWVLSCLVSNLSHLCFCSQCSSVSIKSSASSCSINMNPSTLLHPSGPSEVLIVDFLLDPLAFCDPT